MTIWGFNEQLTRRLFAWNVVNIAIGMLVGRGDEWQRGVGSQSVGWGLVNIGIALIGGRATRQRALKPDAHTPATLHKEARNLRRLLWINSGLDVLYMLGGWWLARREAARPFRRGMGHGIIVQGALLLLFDVIHALDVPSHDER